MFAIGNIDGALVFTLPAPDAFPFVHEPGLLLHSCGEIPIALFQALRFTVGEEDDILMMGRGGHLERRDATGTDIIQKPFNMQALAVEGHKVPGWKRES